MNGPAAGGAAVPLRSAAPPLRAGQWATIAGLSSRPDLNGADCRLLEWHPGLGRWAVRVLNKEAEGVRLREQNLIAAARRSRAAHAQATGERVLVPGVGYGRTRRAPQSMGDEGVVVVLDDQAAHAERTTGRAGEYAAYVAAIQEILAERIRRGMAYLYAERDVVFVDRPRSGPPPPPPVEDGVEHGMTLFAVLEPPHAAPLVITASMDDTVLKLKLRIEAAGGPHFSFQVLSFGGLSLADDTAPLCDVGLGAEATVRVSCPPPTPLRTMSVQQLAQSEWRDAQFIRTLNMFRQMIGTIYAQQSAQHDARRAAARAPARAMLR